MKDTLHLNANPLALRVTRTGDDPSACRLNVSNNCVKTSSTSSDAASIVSGVSAIRPPHESKNVPEQALLQDTIISCSSHTFVTSDEPKY